MIRLRRDYGNGIEIEIEAEMYPDLLQKLSIADELFIDIRCAAKIDGKVELSDKVRFGYREDNDGNKYYEQVCMDSKLKWFKRRISQHKKIKGSMYVDKNPDFKGRDADFELGLAGWHKYIGTSGGESSFNNNGSSYGSNAPQRESAPPPPRREPERQPAASSVSYDDIPF